jgi:hypothetical protein
MTPTTNKIDTADARRDDDVATPITMAHAGHRQLLVRSQEDVALRRRRAVLVGDRATTDGIVTAEDGTNLHVYEEDPQDDDQDMLLLDTPSTTTTYADDSEKGGQETSAAADDLANEKNCSRKKEKDAPNCSCNSCCPTTLSSLLLVHCLQSAVELADLSLLGEDASKDADMVFMDGDEGLREDEDDDKWSILEEARDTFLQAFGVMM